MFERQDLSFDTNPKGLVWPFILRGQKRSKVFLAYLFNCHLFVISVRSGTVTLDNLNLIISKFRSYIM